MGFIFGRFYRFSVKFEDSMAISTRLNKTVSKFLVYNTRWQRVNF